MSRRTTLAPTPHACSVDRMVSSRSLYIAVLAAAGIAHSGCMFDKPINVEYDASLIDAAPPDALTGCEPDTIVCDDDADRYIECGSDGVAELVMDCPLGCYDLAEKCVDVAPSNGLAGYLDQARDDDSVVDFVFTGTSTIDTDTGDVIVGDVPTTIPTAVANGIRIYMFKDLEIPGTLKVSGSLPLALIADGNVTITGVVDVSADKNTSGPGAVETGTCVGGSKANTSSMPIPGGGGAGRAHPGARGGNSADGAAGGAPGEVMSDPDLAPLVGGCRGGSAGFLIFPTPPPNGGGGGGAIQISSRRGIEIVAGGKIDASGGGGNSTGPGPGGGTGGAVLLESPTILVDGAGTVISTKGGAGAGARGTGQPYAPGEDGGTGAEPAIGGALEGFAAGGNGGTDTVPPEIGENGNGANTHGAGGGGSVGEARFNNETAAIVATDGAAIRSFFTTGSIGTRLVP